MLRGLYFFLTQRGKWAGHVADCGKLTLMETSVGVADVGAEVCAIVDEIIMVTIRTAAIARSVER